MNPFIIEELHIITGISIEEIISTHTEPKQMNFLVGLFCLVINFWDGSRGKRTIRAKIRELIKVAESVEQCLVSSARESTNSTMITIIFRSIISLNVRHQIVNEVFAEHIPTELCLRHSWLGRSSQ